MADDLAIFSVGTSDGLLDRRLVGRVTERLGIDERVPLTLSGLKAVYSAWCENVSFDNIRKLINLAKPGSPMPGLDPNDFFESWLAHGCGGTCWPSSNALYALLRSLGFDARRVAASMFDLPMINHGTVKVRLDGEDWVVDTSMLTSSPLPMDRGIHVHDDARVGVEVEPTDNSHVVWIDFVPLTAFVPCRLQIDPVDTSLYLERYEVFSREFSPFNARLYLRKGGREGASVILGSVRFSRTAGGLDVREFSRDELIAHLCNEVGISAELIDEWADLGWLEASFDPSTQGIVPEILGLPPSRR